MARRAQTYLVVLGCWVLWGLFNASRLRFVAPDLDWPTALRFGVPDALIWALLTPIPIYLVRRFPITAGSPVKLVGVHLLAAVALPPIHSAIDATLNAIRSADTWGVLFTKIFRFTFHHNVMMYAVVVGIAYYLAHQRRIRERDRHAAELRARLSEARLEALRMQLRPHFLFNVLHTISGLMDVDPGKGRKVVRQLGELLRMSLAADDVNEVPLERELRFVRLYLELERVRLGERLTVDIEAEPGTLRSAVPVLILQPLVENAVRHGIAKQTRGGHIEVRASVVGERLELVVEDDGPGMGSGTDRLGAQGVGIANTRARLRELYGDDHAFALERGAAGGLRAIVSLPRRAAGPSETLVA